MGKFPAIILSFVLIVFYVVGYGQVYKVINQIAVEEPGLLSGITETIGQYYPVIITTFSLITVLSVVSIIFLVLVMKRYADKILLTALYLFTGLALALGIFMLLLSPILGIIMLIMPVVILLIIIFRRDRIRLAGMFLKMSSDAIWREKQVMLISVVFGVFSVLTTVADLGVLHFVWGYLDYGTMDYAILFVTFLASAWISYSAMYLAEGTVIQITHDWYRNPGKDVANLSRGVGVALERSGPILRLSLVMALLTALRRTLSTQARRSKDAGSALFLVIGAIVASFAKGIIQFVTYFTLPAIIIENKGFKDGVKRSASLVWRYWIDVILGNSGVGLALTLVSIPVLILFGGIGFIFGALVMPGSQIAAFVSALVFVIAGTLPIFIAFKFMYAIYKTILYEYALDEEEGFKRPSTLPREIAGKFREIGSKGGKRKIKQPDF